MNKLRAIYLILSTKAFFILSEKGVASRLPLDREMLEIIQEEVESFDMWLGHLIDDITLEER